VVLIEPGITRGDMGLHVKRQLDLFARQHDGRDWAACRDAKQRFDTLARPALGSATWGVKEVNPVGLPALIETYQPKKIVLMVRDIRDVLVSAVEKCERLNSAFTDDWLLERARDTYACLRQLERSIPAERLRLVHYEAFVKSEAYRQDFADWVGFSLSGDAGARMALYGQDYESERHGGTIGATSLKRHKQPTSPRQEAIVARAMAQMGNYQAHYGYCAAEEAAFLDQFGPDATFAAPGDEAAVGFVGYNPANGQAARAVQGQQPQGVKTPYRVICFHTPDPLYSAAAAKLTASLQAQGVDHRVVVLESSDGWEATCSRKAAFVRQQWEDSDRPVVWLDADATVEKDPVLFAALDCDFAAHKFDGWQLASGTLYFGKTDLARQLLDQWVMRCQADPLGWDQDHLQSAWCDISASSPLRTIWLPRPYLQIFDAPRPVDEEPVVVHWQASRKLGKQAAKVEPLVMTEKGRQDRRVDRLWRSPEEAFWIREGVDHIRPNTATPFPEGFDVRAALDAAIGGHYPVLEVGCGVGRIASLFAPELYRGVDVNPSAVLAARQRLPQHSLRLIDDGFAYPKAETILFYTVLLHLDGPFAVQVLENACASAKRVVIAELMDSRWRRGGNPPVFNRDPEHYILAMQSFGFYLVDAAKYVYAHYDTPHWQQGRDVRMSFLTFERA
jgi:SAM-dependent methyltransferase